MELPNLLRLLLSLPHWMIHFTLGYVHWNLQFWMLAGTWLLRIYLFPLRCIWRWIRKLTQQRAHSSAHQRSKDTRQPFIYEIIQFSVTDAYTNNPELIKRITEYIGAHAPGPICTGLQLEGPTNLLTGLIGWHSKEQHEEFENGPVYDRLAPLVIPIAAGSSETVHASFEPAGEEVQAFGAPITELVWLTPKTGVTISHLSKVLRMTVKEMNESAKSNMTLSGVAAGRVMEKDTLVYVAGWSSVEARQDWVKKQMNPMPNTLSDLADMSRVHLQLSGRR